MFEPAAIATYCRPFATYVIGEPFIGRFRSDSPRRPGWSDFRGFPEARTTGCSNRRRSRHTAARSRHTSSGSLSSDDSDRIAPAGPGGATSGVFRKRERQDVRTGGDRDILPPVRDIRHRGAFHRTIRFEVPEVLPSPGVDGGKTAVALSKKDEPAGRGKDARIVQLDGPGQVDLPGHLAGFNVE